MNPYETFYHRLGKEPAMLNRVTPIDLLHACLTVLIWMVSTQLGVWFAMRVKS